MSARHTSVVTLCIAALLLLSLAFILSVPVAVERAAYGDDPNLSKALSSPELHAWKREKASKLVEIATLFSAVELGDLEVQQRFPSLSHPAEGNSPALGTKTDPVEILDEALHLDPTHFEATVFLAELCARRDARGALSRPRQSWLLRTLDDLRTRPFADSERPRLVGLVRVIEAVIVDAPAERATGLRAWWSSHGAAFLARLSLVDTDLR